LLSFRLYNVCLKHFVCQFLRYSIGLFKIKYPVSKMHLQINICVIIIICTNLIISDHENVGKYNIYCYLFLYIIFLLFQFFLHIVHFETHYMNYKYCMMLLLANFSVLHVIVKKYIYIYIFFFFQGKQWNFNCEFFIVNLCWILQ